MSKQRKLRAYDGFEADLKALYGDCVIYGPYIRNTDERAIVLIRINGRCVTKLYAKFKLEIKLGRMLTKNETVDHIDDNPFNDRFSNLRLLSRAQNASRAVPRRKIHSCSCAWCGVVFTPTRSQADKGQNAHAGPFCTKSCAGKYGKYIQSGGTPLDRAPITKTYHKIEEPA